MSPETLTAQVIGYFLSETLKNIAKGTANVAYKNFDLLFYSEITTLGLSVSTTPEEIAARFEEQPKLLETAQEKLSAYPQVVEEITKIIKEQTGRDLTTINASDIFSSNVSSHNQSGGQTAHTIINNPLLRASPAKRLQIDVKYSLEQETDVRDTYRLIIALTNTGDEPISDYRLDIKIPRSYLNDLTIISGEETEKSTEQYRFFRITSKSQEYPIYPNDRRIIFSPNYYVGGHIPHNDFLTLQVYVDERLMRNVEKPMSELVSR